jgi:hypothetical protein
MEPDCGPRGGNTYHQGAASCSIYLVEAGSETQRAAATTRDARIGCGAT